MKRLFQTFAIAIILLAITSTVLYAQSDFYEKRWSNVYRYELKGFSKQALAVTDSIYTRAKRDKDAPQFIKALIYQSKFTLRLQEDAELSIVQNFENEIKISKSPLKNILESMLAQLYWQYFKEHRQNYYSRSRLTVKVNFDFRTWDANAMFEEIHRHFQNSLYDAQILGGISLATIDDILIQAEKSKLYRHTLYDFVAHNALDFYSTSESLVTKPINSFTLKDTRYFDQFEKLAITSPDSLSPLLQALKIYKDLMAFHKETKDTTAYVNLEIERLRFVVSEGVFDDASDLHKKALAKLRTEVKSHPSSTLLATELASMLNQEGDTYTLNSHTQNQFKKKEALDICEEAISSFPQSEGAANCRIIKANILAQSLALTAEDYVPISMPSRILLNYKNIDSLTFTAFKIDKEFNDNFSQLFNDSMRVAEIKKLTPFLTWKAGLMNLHDHHAHSTEVIIPALPQGRYLLLARVKDSISLNKDELFAFSSIQVTNIVLIETKFVNKYRYQVVDRNSGKPIEGADVHFKTPKKPYLKTEIIDERYISDKNGFVELKNSYQYSNDVQSTIGYKNDQATFGDYYIYPGERQSEKVDEDITAKVFLFSDRSIYRPGQTVYFKGILIKTKNKKSSVVGGEYVEVTLEDVNNKEVALLRLKTNSFGSFSGEFKLPDTGLSGEYTITADEDSEYDSKFYDNLDDFQWEDLIISVEEYKRPTFEASFKPIKETFRLYDSISVKGSAVAFSGSKVSGAKVSYHVKRNVRYPRWYYWYYPNSYSQQKEIAFGESITDKNGEFIINFNAAPDETVSKVERPVFHYEVTVDVTDINGETRSAATIVKVGYHSLLAIAQIPEIVDRKITTNTISITTENLNGQFVPTKGTIRVYKLKSPSAPVRIRPWDEPDLQSISEEAFEKLFPHDPYKANNDSKTWAKGKLMVESSFNTALSKELVLKTDDSWMVGKYIIELNTIDPSGEPIKDMQQFTVVDLASKLIQDQQLMVFELDKSAYKVGDVANLKIGSASKDITITIDIEKNHQIAKTYVEHFSNNVKEIRIPVTESMGNGFAIYASATCYNSFIDESKTLQIIPEDEQIEIETLTFKDKLQPGAKETWSFAIKGKDQSRKEAEVLASMYDASLDQFKKHEWSFEPVQKSSYYGSGNISGSESFGEKIFTVRNLHYQNSKVAGHYYDGLDWFGFSFTNNYYINQQYMQRLYSYGSDYDDAPSKVTMTNTRNFHKGFIQGKITTHEGEALPGVNVLVKGTIRGAVTDVDGNYSIEAEKDEVLIFSYIGYSAAEAVIGKKNTINVVMEEDIMSLSEIVVVGYGIQMKKQSIASSVTFVTSTTKESDFELSYNLQGRMAGVQLTGMPGGDAKILIRGTSSLGANAQPLYVVDGVIVENSEIDQADLADITIMKYEAATALYGSRAANGVILISTKSGQKKLDEEMAKVTARKNFNETAFFFPHLKMDESGNIQFSFTTPESLTRWKLQLLAHTRDLITTTKTLQAVTQKELMVTPNAPRFVRVGDDIILSVKIANLSGRNLEGKVALQLSDAVTGEGVDVAFKNIVRNQTFKISAKGTTEVSWKLNVPTGIDALQYKVVAKAGNFSDGEQNALPVLSNRMLVTETLPMYIRSGQTKTFNLNKLKTTTSATLQHHQLTLEVASNPAWYAIQSLPYLMEYPWECAEQTFSRYYSNTLASHIANSNPKIKAVFDKWATSGELISNLEKNQELKSIIIQETPWLRDAQSESEQKKRIALLFDLNTLNGQQQSAITKLIDMQMGNGGFPWFSGSEYASPYITRHIASGFGHLKQLHVTKDNDQLIQVINKAVGYLDLEMVQDYDALLKQAERIRLETMNKEDGLRLEKEYLARQQIHYEHIHYLYMRSFYPDLKPDEKVNTMIEYYRSQSARYWMSFSLYFKGMIALFQYRNQNTRLAKEILTSVKENSIVSEELGMYWKENNYGWYWYEAPVETHALMIEAFAEIESQDNSLTEQQKRKTIDELRIWLLKNKQTNQWKTTKATTEAIYALLLNGSDWISLEDQVEASIGNKKVIVDTRQPEAGIGYFKTTWKGKTITPEMAEVTLTKKADGIAWAGLYWQYFEDLDKIEASDTPLKLTKKVFRVSNTDKGELLTEINTGGLLKVGDLLRIRIELKADRVMEFLHMKDMRASCLEPLDVLSEYKWQGGLGYYQSTKDASTNFFFDSIQKGIYVFEYDLRVNNKGNFSNGITTIQSMYAPEFSSHSEGIKINVE